MFILFLYYLSLKNRINMVAMNMVEKTNVTISDILDVFLLNLSAVIPIDISVKYNIIIVIGKIKLKYCSWLAKF